jgi:phosphoacetylglucosamine mutase
LTIDCANGVGFNTFKEFVPKISQYFKPTLINTEISNKKLLNYDCGAEYIHKENRFPSNFDDSAKACAFDGDADRLIYFSKRTSEDTRPTVIDGDKQFALIMTYVKKLLDEMNCADLVPYVLVNTAYSNG